VQEDGVERNCVASAMLWEYAMAGRNGVVYPAKKGVRDKRMFDGRVAHRVYIFSGGSAETSLKYQAIASTIATSISTLELTKVGSYLDGDRVNYSAHILEREWQGKKGNGHPTGLLTMNVAGLKADCLPQILHCHMAKRSLQDLVEQISHEEAEKIRSNAVSAFLGNNLNEDDLLNTFRLEIPSFTRQDINQASVSEETVHEFLKSKIAELHDTTTAAFEKKKKNEELSTFVEKVMVNFLERGGETALTPGYYLKGAATYYQKLASILDEKLTSVSASISKVEETLLEGKNQRTLDTLLDKLAIATKKKKGVGDIVVRLGESTTVSLINQIIDTLSQIQEQKVEKYEHLLLQHIYGSLHKMVQEQHDMLKMYIYKYSTLISQLDREIEMVKRIGRSAFTYNKSKFDELTDYLLEKIYPKLDTISTQEVVEKLGAPTGSNGGFNELEYLEDVLKLLRPDLNHLTKLVDELFCEDPKVYDYVKSMLDQFFMTLKLDRDRFPILETSQASFVMCTNRYYEKYKDDLFEGYSHIETENPFNITVTKHEEGFPFSAISYMHRINEDFKEIRSYNQSAFGHIMADLEDKLPLLDE
jgi:hemoglobin-like flavoprotein